MNPKPDDNANTVPRNNAAHSIHRRLTVLTNAAKFPLGQVVATPGALTLMETHKVTPATLLLRHVHGDWGDVCGDDGQLNELALNDGSRIFSVYRIVDEKTLSETPRAQRHTLPTLWVITNAANEFGVRDVTTLLLPEDY
jgi:hypothetical protein